MTNPLDSRWMARYYLFLAAVHALIAVTLRSKAGYKLVTEAGWLQFSLGASRQLALINTATVAFCIIAGWIYAQSGVNSENVYERLH